MAVLAVVVLLIAVGIGVAVWRSSKQDGTDAVPFDPVRPDPEPPPET
jgi:hypothetical protein